MLTPAKRIIQRYLLPSSITAIYYSIRYHCMISLSTKVQLTQNLSFGRGTVVKPYSVIQTNTGKISIGKKCSIGNFNVIASGDALITIGDFVRIGPHVVILGSLRNYKDISKRIIDQGYSHDGVTIGDDVMIGAGVTILAGSNIGTGVVIGAGSVITKNIDPYAIVAGVPAKVMGKRK